MHISAWWEMSTGFLNQFSPLLTVTVEHLPAEQEAKHGSNKILRARENFGTRFWEWSLIVPGSLINGLLGHLLIKLEKYPKLGSLFIYYFLWQLRTSNKDLILLFFQNKILSAKHNMNWVRMKAQISLWKNTTLSQFHNTVKRGYST